MGYILPLGALDTALEAFSGDRLGTILSRQNPWWGQEGTAAPRAGISTYARRDLAGVIDSLGDRSVHAVVGPRQAGKTTMLRQVTPG